ncbi:MAG: hypothetical protein AAGD25_34385 [Cyanobacteria bacterium P01_F01_bin.150]
MPNCSKNELRPLQTPNIAEGQAVQIIISTIVHQTQIDLMDTTTDVDAPVPFQPASGRFLYEYEYSKRAKQKESIDKNG